jgi:hypothetical protein
MDSTFGGSENAGRSEKMKERNRLCPFLHRACEQCAMYRGKHINVTVHKGSAGSSAEGNYGTGDGKTVDSAAIKDFFDLRIKCS